MNAAMARQRPASGLRRPALIRRAVGRLDTRAGQRTLPPMDVAERDRLRSTYRAALCDLETAGTWEPLSALPPAQAEGLVLTAWNPRSRPLPAAVNRARDHVLRGELAALDLAPLRARGRDAAATWIEDGWLIPHRRERSLHLLRRYGQAAGYVFGAHGRRLLWADGEEERI